MMDINLTDNVGAAEALENAKISALIIEYYKKTNNPTSYLINYPDQGKQGCSKRGWRLYAFEIA